MDEARFTLRIHPIIMNKMKHIARSNGRSVNKEIEQILKWVVDDYERKYGRVVLSDEEMETKSNKKIEPVAEQPMDMLFKLEKQFFKIVYVLSDKGSDIVGETIVCILFLAALYYVIKFLFNHMSSSDDDDGPGGFTGNPFV